jgi:hypothetical protein
MIQGSAALLQRSSTVVAANGGCVNCHHQILTGVAVAAAREKAVPVDEVAAAEQWKAMLVGLRGRENTAVQRIVCCGGLDSTLYALSALQANKYPADAITDAAVVNLMSLQLTDGRWSREFASRSPLQDGDINRVALAVSALQAYAPPVLKAEVREHVARARRWLMSAQPKTTDDRAMLVVGLRHAGAPQSRIQAAAKALLELQGTDGGWAGNRNLESDPYATSEVLGALFDAGVLTSRTAAYQRGVQFLLGTRAKDGSWYVRSRATKFQPYFESGFPYGHDQWISIAATARAVVALSRYIQ